MNKNPQRHERIKSGIRNFDELLFGGLPKGSVSVIGGTPGAGKTTMALQMCFQQATAGKKVIYFQTLSEPVPKTIKNMSAFDFFDPSQIDKKIFFCDLGGIMRSQGLATASASVVEQMKKVKPDFVVIDSFRVFEDLAGSDEELRKFTYEVAVNLMAWECTAFLLGEYNSKELETNPLSSIVDGIILLTAGLEGEEFQRFIRIAKMRGTNHDQNRFPLSISDKGIEVYPPRVTLRRGRLAEAGASGKSIRTKFAVPSLDKLLGPGIPLGSSVLVAGEAGVGKTTLLLEAIYRGAKDLGEKGIFFSFSDSTASLLATAQSLGWDLEREIKRDLVEIHFVPMDTVLVESNLLMMKDRIVEFAPKRIAIDSVSIFLHKLESAIAMREKLYLVTTLIKESHALGLLSYDIPLGHQRVTRFGVEEALVDGVIVLSKNLEIIKLRSTLHVRGPHALKIGKGGVSVGAAGKRKR